MSSTESHFLTWPRWVLVAVLVAMSLAMGIGSLVRAQSSDTGQLPTGELTVSLDESSLPTDIPNSPELRGRWTLILNENETFALSRADAGMVATGSYTAGPASLQFTRWDGIVGCQIGEDDAAVSYAWSVNDQRVALTAVNDTCADRVVLLTTREFGSLSACEVTRPQKDDPFASAHVEGTPETRQSQIQGVAAQEGYSEEAELEAVVDTLLRQVSGCWDATNVEGFMALHGQGVQAQIATMGPPEPFVSELQSFMQLPLHLERIGTVHLGDIDHAWVYVEVNLDGQALPQRLNLIRESGVWLLDSFFLFGPPPPEGANFA